MFRDTTNACALFTYCRYNIKFINQQLKYNMGIYSYITIKRPQPLFFWLWPKVNNMKKSLN